MIRSLAVALVVAGCGGSPTTPLVDLPVLRVLTDSVGRGSTVPLEIENSTSSALTIPAPACSLRLERLYVDDWGEIPHGNPSCVGATLTVPVGERHPFAHPIPPQEQGRYRVVLRGSNADGAFIVRSPGFIVR